MKKNDNLETDLKINGLKNTKHRTAILDILDKSIQPVDAQQIFIQLQEKGVSINLSTVYRTLDTLVSKDIVTQLNISGDSRSLFEYNRMVHRHYLVCVACKKILTILHCPLESYEKSLESQTDFSIVGHKLYIYGYCTNCKQK